MILNFLQTRNPPILPSLHQQFAAEKASTEGKYSSFNDDIDQLRGYGKDNKETLGELLFQFFRRYGHDIDYAKNVISVREGRSISKEAKRWHLMQNNRLCVEEPFNTERNLGNTADDISFRGIHLELRRAFDLVSAARLDECLEQYSFPATEERFWEKPAPKPAPVLARSRSQSQSSRGNKGGGHGSRGGRHHPNNNHPKSRRASSAASTNKLPLQPNGVHGPGDRPLLSHDQVIQAQFDQLKLNRLFFDEMQTLQRQEYELRLKQAQNQLQAEMQLQTSGDGPPNAPRSARELSHRFQTATQVSLTAPLRAGPHFPPFAYPQVPGTPHQNGHTQPSSPSLRSVQPDLRRSLHRSSAADGSSIGSIRSHSQPARAMPVNVAMQTAPPIPLNPQQFLHYQSLHQQQQSQQDQLYHAFEAQGGYRHTEGPMYQDPRRHSMQPPFEDITFKEYAGYWIPDSPPSHAYREDVRMPRMPQPLDLHSKIRGIPPIVGRLRDESRSPSPSPALPLRDRAFSLQSASSGPIRRQRFERVQGTGPPRPSGPIIVNGTDACPLPDFAPTPESSSHTTTVSETTSRSDDQQYETSATGEMESYLNGINEDSFMNDPHRHHYHGYPLLERPQNIRLDPKGNIEPRSGRLSNRLTDPVASNDTSKHSERTRKSGGGLGIQFGEVEYTYPASRPDPSAIREQSRTSNNVSQTDPQTTVSSTSHPEKALIPVPLLSPVREVRTPSPVGKRKEDFASIAKVGGMTRPSPGKMNLYIPAFSELAKAKKEKDKVQQGQGRQEGNGRANDSRSPKANGVTPLKSPPKTIIDHHPRPAQNTPSSVSPNPSGSQMQANGWQQQVSKKNKKNRSRPGSGQYPGEPLPANPAERKGG